MVIWRLFFRFGHHSLLISIHVYARIFIRKTKCIDIKIKKNKITLIFYFYNYVVYVYMYISRLNNQSPKTIFHKSILPLDILHIYWNSFYFSVCTPGHRRNNMLTIYWNMVFHGFVWYRYYLVVFINTEYVWDVAFLDHSFANHAERGSDHLMIWAVLYSLHVHKDTICTFNDSIICNNIIVIVWIKTNKCTPCKTLTSSPNLVHVTISNLIKKTCLHW